MKIWQASLALLAFVSLCAFDINGGGGGALSQGGDLMPFLINPDAISPRNGSKLLFVSKDWGNDANDCLSVSLACKTIGHAVSLASAGDVIGVYPSTSTLYLEQLNITTDFLTLVGLQNQKAQYSTSLWAPHLANGTGTPLAFNATGDALIHFYVGCANFAGPCVQTGHGTVLRHVLIEDGYDGMGPALKLEHGGAIIEDSLIQFGAPNVLFSHNGGSVARFTHDTFNFTYGGYTVATDTAGNDPSTVINDVSFKDCQFRDSPANISGYFDINPPTGGGSDVYVENSTFMTPLLARRKLYNLIRVHLSGTSPIGDPGSSISDTSQQDTVTSSNITTSPQFLFTADGAVNISDIILETGSTGLAGGTNVEITTDNASGAATVCAEAVANLGANKTVSCANASVTKLVPFTLEDTKSLKINCTGVDCSGAGTITIKPVMTRQQQYASVIAIPVPSPTPTPTPAPTATPT